MITTKNQTKYIIIIIDEAISPATLEKPTDSSEKKSFEQLQTNKENKLTNSVF
jgi:hypothetical protein